MHYSICVIHEDGTDVADALAPFDENLDVKQEFEDGEPYWYNPDGRWDWYQIGGRWCGAIKLKDGVEPTPDMYGEPSLLFDKTVDPYFHARGEHWVDSALIEDIDTSLDMQAWNKALEDWDKAMNGEAIGLFETDKTLLRDYIIKENYAACRALFYFGYVIDYDGRWHQMWPDYSWSMNISDRLKWAQEFERRFLYPLRYGNKKYRLTAVDIHN